MRARSVAAAVFASTMFSFAASATAPPDNVLFAGFFVPKMKNPSGNGTWCMIDGANSTFVQAQTRGITLISFPDILYTTAGSVGPTAYRLGGQARLLFNNASTTSGKVIFNANAAAPVAISQPAFNNFSQNYIATNHSLEVKFNILLAGCTLPIDAVYRN